MGNKYRNLGTSRYKLYKMKKIKIVFIITILFFTSCSVEEQLNETISSSKNIIKKVNDEKEHSTSNLDSIVVKNTIQDKETLTMQQVENNNRGRQATLSRIMHVINGAPTDIVYATIEYYNSNSNKMQIRNSFLTLGISHIDMGENKDLFTYTVADTPSVNNIISNGHQNFIILNSYNPFSRKITYTSGITAIEKQNTRDYFIDYNDGSISFSLDYYIPISTSPDIDIWIFKCCASGTDICPVIIGHNKITNETEVND